MSIDLCRGPGVNHAPVSPRRAAADTGNGDDSGSEQSAFMGDLEVAGTGETRDDDMLVTPEMAAVVEEAVRRWRGWDQGCVLSIFASVYPYHLACHAVVKKRPGLRIAAFVDDTYLGQVGAGTGSCTRTSISSANRPSG